MTCSRCGRLNPEDAAVCAGCGYRLDAEPGSPDPNDAPPKMRTRSEAARPEGPAGSVPGIRGPASGDDSTTPSGDGSDESPTASYGSGRTGTSPHPEEHPGPLAPGTQLGKRYRIESILGEGGMGAVYRAHDRELNRTVALKVIRPELTTRPTAVERFKREIFLASKVTHRNVLRIHDLGEAGGLRFISMHYVEGTNLKDLLRREGRLPIERALPLIHQIGEALQAAHEAGVVHRDLKPQNVLIDREGRPYIADFGISRSLEAGATMTETGALLGTVDYMSPEQARGEQVDHRSDIYSLGMIIYEILAGSVPFRSDNPLSVMMQRVHQDAPTLRQARSDIPPWLSSIVSRAMARKVDARYESVRDLLRDLDRHRISIAWRRLLKSRVLVPACGGLLLLAGLATGIYYWLDRPPTFEVPKVSLVLLPFRNATGDERYEWIEAGLPSLLRADLMQSSALSPVGEERLQKVLEGLKIADPADIRPSTLRRVANLLGVDNMVTGSLMKAGDRFRLEVSLTQAGASTVSPGAAILLEGEGEESLFTMVDALTLRIRDQLGVSRTRREADRVATDLTTGSVEALRLYSEGLALARAGNQLDAARRLEAALERDGEFAVARALLAETYDRLGYGDRAVEEADKAAGNLRNVSTYEATRIRAVRARLASDLQAAEKAYRKLSEISPNSAEPLLDLALVQEDQGELEAALESLERVLALDPKHPNARFALGRVQIKLGNATEALREFNTALGLHLELGNEEGRAEVLNGLGNTYDFLGRYDEALDHYRQSLAIRREIGDRRGMSVALMNVAMIYGVQGHYEEAIGAAREAVKVSTDIGDWRGLSDAYSTLGDIYEQSGHTEEALRAYQESLKIVRRVGDDAALAREYASIGYINYVLGRYLEAFFFHKEALEKRRQMGDRADIIQSLVDMGIVEEVQGRYEESIELYLEALSLAREAGQTEPVSIALASLANVHADQGEYGTALKLVAEAEAAARETGGVRLIAACLGSRGNTLRRVGDHAGAETSLAKALALARDANNTPLVAEILVYLGDLQLARGRRERAAATLREAVSEAEATKQHRLTLLARLKAAQAEGSAGELEPILEEARSSGLAPLLAPALLATARIHQAAGRYAEASRQVERAIESATPLMQRDLLFQAHHLAGAILQHDGRAGAALEHYAGALDLLEEMRQDLKSPYLQRFLERPESAAFAREAEKLFRAADRSRQLERLRSALRP